MANGRFAWRIVDGEWRMANWAWRIVVGAFWLTAAAIAVMAVALGLGAADPPRAGRLAWEQGFADLAGWEAYQTGEAGWSVGQVGLQIALSGAGDTVFMVTDAPAGRFTFEVAGAQSSGPGGAMYGLVFDFADPQTYAAVLVNGNGYARAFRQAGEEVHEWFGLGQWPHILAGAEANRVRLDSMFGRLTFRVNDEILAEAPGAARGRIGVAAYATDAGQTVVFSWARLWADSTESTMLR